MNIFRFTQAIPLTVVLVCSSANATTGLCDDPRIDMTSSQRQGCRDHEVIYRQSGFSSRTQLAQIVSGVRCSGDYCPATYRYVLLLVTGDLVHIEDFPPWENVIPTIRMWSALGLSSTIRASPGVLYDRVVERVDDRYCHIYEMKAPFVGKLRDCAGRHAEPEGYVAYAEGTVRAADAWRLACAIAVAGTTRQCRTNDVSTVWTVIRRDANQRLYYVAALRRDHPTPDIAYEYLLYRVDALTSDVQLLERRLNHPNTIEFGAW